MFGWKLLHFFSATWVKNCIYIVVITILCVVALEFFLGFVEKATPRYVSYEFYSNLLGDLPPNIDRVDNLIKDLPYHVKTDKEGFRVGPGDGAFDPKLKRIRILCLGDSFTYGVGVSGEFTYPYLLSVFLKKKYPDYVFEVVNAGIPFFDIVDALDYWEEKGSQLHPDIVICQFYNNDVQTMNGASFRRSRRLPPKKYNYLLDSIKNTRIMQLSSAVSYKLAKQTVQPEAKGHDAWHDGKYCGALTDRQIEIVNTTRELLDQKNLEAVRCRWEAYFRNLSELKERVQKSGAKFLFINIPDRMQLFEDLSAPSAFLNKNLDQAQITHIDFLKIFRSMFHEHEMELYNHPYDFHLNKIGTTLVAHEVSNIIELGADSSMATLGKYENYDYSDLHNVTVVYDNGKLVSANNTGLLSIDREKNAVVYQGKDTERDRVEATVYEGTPGELFLDVNLAKQSHYFSVYLSPIFWSEGNGGLKGYITFDNGKAAVLIDRRANDPRSPRSIFEQYSPGDGFSKVKLQFFIGPSAGLIFDKNVDALHDYFSLKFD